MNWHQVCMTISALILSSFLVSCSLPSQPTGNAGRIDASSGSATEPATAGNFDLGGAIQVDAFNDQVTGQEVPADGGQIIVRFNAEPHTLSTWLSTTDAYSTYISTYYIYDTLLWENWETFELEPNLAERWIEEDIVLKKDQSRLRGTVVSGEVGATGEVQLRTLAGEILRVPAQDVEEIRRGVAFTFYLRKDVRFHDGQPFTAVDVKFSLDTILNEHVDAPDMRQQYVDIESYEVLDPYTIRVTFSKQFWMARINLGKFLEILPKHVYDPDNLQERDPEAFGKRFNESEYHRKPVGTGPYKFERWETGRQVILTRNEDYWNDRRRGHLDRIVFRFISDSVAALQGLKNGEINFIAGRLSGEQFDTEMNDPEFLRKFAKPEFYTPGFCWIGWNMRHPPLDDVNVRRALAYGAFDRKKFLEEVRNGHGIQVASYQYFFGPAYDHTLEPYPYDPAKAKQLLLQAGWFDHDGDGLRDKNGQPFRFEFMISTGSSLGERIAPIMKENFRQLGIDMSIRQLEWATFIQDLTERRFDICTLCWAGDIESDPYQIWHTSQASGRGSNYVGFGNAETDRVIEESRRTLDDDKRRDLLMRFDRILHENQPYLFLYLLSDLAAYDKRYRGVKFYRPRPGYDLTEWFLPNGAAAP